MYLEELRGKKFEVFVFKKLFKVYLVLWFFFGVSYELGFKLIFFCLEVLR